VVEESEEAKEGTWKVEGGGGDEDFEVVGVGTEGG
jgi:hypothetical protein